MKCQCTVIAGVMRQTKANCLLLARQLLDSKREINSTHDYMQSDSLLVEKSTLKTNHLVDKKLRHVWA